MIIEGYKAFNKGLINNYGTKFKEHQTYEIDFRYGNLKYGTRGYGFHFAKRLEDCLRFFNGISDKIEIAKVIALGDVKESYDDYYGYYDLYVTDQLYIDYVLSREEIIEYIKKANEFRIERFVQGYKLKNDEINTILSENPNNIRIINAINYYQYNDEYTYKKTSRR